MACILWLKSIMNFNRIVQQRQSCPYISALTPQQSSAIYQSKYHPDFVIFLSGVELGIYFTAQGIRDAVYVYFSLMRVNGDALKLCNLGRSAPFFAPLHLNLDKQAGSFFMWISKISPSCLPVSLTQAHSYTPSGCHVGVLIRRKCRLNSFTCLHD